MESVSRLIEPIEVGGVKLKNRMALLPMSTEDSRDYVVTPEVVAFYESMARGGAGLIIVGAMIVTDLRGTHPAYESTPKCPGIFSDELIPNMRKLTEAVHKHGAKICAQVDLHYEWRKGPDAPVESVGPSAGPSAPHIPPARELTVDEIHQIVGQFGDAGRRARDAGFDMVELHPGIGYFLSRFLSSYSNKRTDEYGGTALKRLRIVLDIIEDIKKKAGADYPITVRFSAEDYMPGGNTLADALEIAPALEKAGVCLLNVQVGFHEAPKAMIQRWTPQGAFLYVTEAIKKVVKIPVIAAYRLVDPVIGNQAIVDGKTDMIGMARALIADPELPNKVMAGKIDDVNPCICCCRCLDDVREGKPMTCSVNAQRGKAELKPASAKKKVLVIGAGPGGMEAARVAALRGHKVTLCDENPRLGGLVLLAAVLNPELVKWSNYLRRQVTKLPIDIKLKTKVTPAMVSAMKPDVVVVAAGGVYPTFKIPGADSNKVLSGHDIMDMANGRPVAKGILWQLASIFAPMMYSPSLFRWGLGLPWPIGKKVVVVGGGFAGCELAEVMSEKGRDVTIVEQTSKIGEDIGMTERWYVKILLKEHKVKTLTNTVVEAITSEGVRVRSGESTTVLPADTVITAAKLTANSKLYDEFKGKAPNVYAVGDFANPGRIREAMSSGFQIGSEI
ncbi:MAG: FAD-dependent oxidoreductase [Smithellaceae bacterium]